MVNKKFKNNVVYTISSILLIVIILILIGQATLTGNIVKRTTCVDNEPQNNEFVYGEVFIQHRTGKTIYQDVCATDFNVRQYLCEGAGTRIGTRSAYCENGCLNGVCK